MSQLEATYRNEVISRLERLTGGPNASALDDAAGLIVESLNAGGIIHAFGTGHSEAFAMEVAGRAGGLIPTNRIAGDDVALQGCALRPATCGGVPQVIRRRPWPTARRPSRGCTTADVFVITSNSGVNGWWSAWRSCSQTAATR